MKKPLKTPMNGEQLAKYDAARKADEEDYSIPLDLVEPALRRAGITDRAEKERVNGIAERVEDAYEGYRIGVVREGNYLAEQAAPEGGHTPDTLREETKRQEAALKSALGNAHAAEVIREIHNTVDAGIKTALGKGVVD